MSDWDEWSAFGIALAAAGVLIVVLGAVIALVQRLIASRWGIHPSQLRRVRRPLQALLVAAAAWVVIAGWLPGSLRFGEEVALHVVRIGLIVVCGWLLAGVVSLGFARMLARYPMDVADNRVARRAHTQLTILRRVTVAIIVLLTLGAVLLTFPAVQAVGASLLASAGVVSLIAGLAAQSTLGNVFAGLQLAFSDAIRVDDVVIAEGEWGRIEEITMTYVVVRIWDDRRLVLPSTYFTATPFENWTRHGSELLGSVELDLDWRVSPARMREHLDELLADQPLWDGRSAALQITNATGGYVRVRVTVTAANAGSLWDLRCTLREALVEWVHQENAAALPRIRLEANSREPVPTGTPARSDVD